jgi:hypothetical protein
MNLTPLQRYIYNYEVEVSGEDFARKELDNIKKLNTLTDMLNYYSSYRGWAQDSGLRNEMIKLMTVAKEKFNTPVSEQIEEAEKLMKRAGIKSEARILPVKMPNYKYKVGETVREENGDEEACKILDRRVDWNAVKMDPVDKQYLPMFMDHDEETDNNPWYLVQWLEHNADKKPTWWTEDELQPYYEKNNDEDEDEDEIDEAQVTPVGMGKIENYRISWYDGSFQFKQEKVKTSLANAERIAIDGLKKQYKHRESDDYWVDMDRNLGDDIIPRREEVERISLDSEPDGLYARVKVRNNDTRAYELTKKIKLQDEVDEARITPVGMNLNIVSQTTDKDGEPVYDIDKDKLYKLLSRHFPKDILDRDFSDYIDAIIMDTGLEEYINITQAKEWIEDFKNYSEYYDDLFEARITPVGIPSQKYGTADWVHQWADDDYDTLVYELGEDTADMVWLLTSIIDINKQSTLSIADVRKFRESIYSDGYEGSVDDLIKNLLDYKVIVPITTNEARVTPVGIKYNATLKIDGDDIYLIDNNTEEEYPGRIENNIAIFWITDIEDPYDKNWEFPKALYPMLKVGGEYEIYEGAEGYDIDISINLDTLKKLYRVESTTNEARVTPVGISKYNNATLRIPDNTGKTYIDKNIYLIDNTGGRFVGVDIGNNQYKFIDYYGCEDDDSGDYVAGDDENIIFDTENYELPKVFIQMLDAGGELNRSFGMCYEYAVTIDLDILKKLYPVKSTTNEARVTPTTSMNRVSANYVNLINDAISKSIVKIIKENMKYVGDSVDIVKTLLSDNKLGLLIEKYIKSKMIETNAEIVRNGVPDIVTRANVNTLTDNEMLDFIEDNKAVQQYISKLFWKSYLELIDIDAVKKIIKDKYYNPQYENEYNDSEITHLIYMDINRNMYGEDIFPYADTHLISDEFADVLERELPKEIFEARVTPVAIGSLRSDDLIEIILKEYDNNPNFFTDDNLDIVSKDELYKDLKESDSRLIIDILVGLEIHQEILDFYSKYKKVVIDGTDYTKYFTKYINNTNEARVTPVSMSRYNNAEVNIIDNDFVVIEDNEGNEYNGDIENDGTVNFLLIFESDDNTLEFMDEEEIFDTIAPEVFKQIRDAGGKIGASSDSIDVTIDVKTLKKLYPTKYIDNTNEARITPVGMNKPIEIPSEWDEDDNYSDDPDEDGYTTIIRFYAPYEGWDPDDTDSVYIRKTPKGTFEVSTSDSFSGGYYDQEEYSTLRAAEEAAVVIMKDIMSNWPDRDEDDKDEDDYDDVAEARVTPIGISKIQLPDKWKEFSVDPKPDLEEDFEVESYGAPMEGWDTNNYDFVNIMSTPKYDALADEEWDENTPPLETKYFISTYIAFGGIENEDKRYDSLSEARKRAVEVMKEIMQDWDDEEY